MLEKLIFLKHFVAIKFGYLILFSHEQTNISIHGMIPMDLQLDKGDIHMENVWPSLHGNKVPLPLFCPNFEKGIFFKREKN